MSTRGLQRQWRGLPFFRSSLTSSLSFSLLRCVACCLLWLREPTSSNKKRVSSCRPINTLLFRFAAVRPDQLFSDGKKREELRLFAEATGKEHIGSPKSKHQTMTSERETRFSRKPTSENNRSRARKSQSNFDRKLFLNFFSFFLPRVLFGVCAGLGKGLGRLLPLGLFCGGFFGGRGGEDLRFPIYRPSLQQQLSDGIAFYLCWFCRRLGNNTNYGWEAIGVFASRFCFE